MSESQLEKLLAQQHTREQDIVDVDEPVIKLVIFSLAEYYFALPGATIKEVLQGDEAVFFVPGMPSSVEGVINVRGDIESVIKLNGLLGLPDSAEKFPHHSSSILLAHGNAMHSGLRVERLLDVVDIALNQIQPAPDALPEYLQPYVTGLLEFNDLAVAVLDIDALFAAWQQGQG